MEELGKFKNTNISGIEPANFQLVAYRLSQGKKISGLTKREKLHKKPPLASRTRVLSSAEASNEPTGSGYYGFETEACVTYILTYVRS
jgi:hypothetical protein